MNISLFQFDEQTLLLCKMDVSKNIINDVFTILTILQWSMILSN